MLITKGYHQAHYEAVKMQELGHKDIGLIGTVHELHAFKNGYGVSVVKGELISSGMYEVAVVRFSNVPKRPLRSKRKRHIKKYMKNLIQGGYELDYTTPLLEDVDRYDTYTEVLQFIDRVSRLPKK